MHIYVTWRRIFAPLLDLLLVLLVAGSALAQTPVPGATGIVTRNANLRAGPGTTYAIAGSVTARAKVQIVEQTAAGDWYKLENGKWIAAFLVTVADPTAIPQMGDNKSAASEATVTATATSQAGVAARTTALQNGNLREGPGTSYTVVGSLKAGAAVEPFGRNSAGDWIQLADGSWVAESLLSGVPADLPVTAVSAQLPGGNPTKVPTAVPAQPAGQTPAAAATPIPVTRSWQTEQNGVIFASDCPCDQGDVLNCPDFGIAMDAQACYLRCQELTGRDVHRLDRDKDGSACEWSW